jgi:hypothetical protein
MQCMRIRFVWLFIWFPSNHKKVRYSISSLHLYCRHGRKSFGWSNTYIGASLGWMMMTVSCRWACGEHPGGLGCIICPLVGKLSCWARAHPSAKMLSDFGIYGGVSKFTSEMLCGADGSWCRYIQSMKFCPMWSKEVANPLATSCKPKRDGKLEAYE